MTGTTFWNTNARAMIGNAGKMAPQLGVSVSREVSTSPTATPRRARKETTIRRTSAPLKLSILACGRMKQAPPMMAVNSVAAVRMGRSEYFEISSDDLLMYAMSRQYCRKR
jgi:hypothetical protein